MNRHLSTVSVVADICAAALLAVVVSTGLTPGVVPVLATAIALAVSAQALRALTVPSPVDRAVLDDGSSQVSTGVSTLRSRGFSQDLAA